MSQYNLLDTETVTLNDILSNGKRYQVPDFQRDYSWQEEHWDDLWADILMVRDDKNPVHYMGAIVLQDFGSKRFGLIDGQQRLATLSLVALAVISRLGDLVRDGIDVSENQERLLRLTEQYIGEKDAVSLRYSNKIKLNENNESFYSSYLVQSREPLNLHRATNSNNLLFKAFSYFRDKVRELFGNVTKGEELADFLQNQVAEKLAFIQIVVKDDLDAYTVFETLNSRGVELSTSDLLKNYLLSLTARSEVDKLQAKEQWQRIIQITDLKKFPTFLRHFWHSRYEIVRKEQLFKALRKSVTSTADAFTLLDDLEKYAAVYSALQNPFDELWIEKKEIRKRIGELKLFGVSQPFPLLLEAYFRLPDQFDQIVRFCSVIAFRYNVIGGLDPKSQERIFHFAAKKVFNGEVTNAKQLAQELRSIYLSDEAFRNSFSTKQLNTRSRKKLARYVLFELENQVALTDRSYEDETATIEHILPENPSLEWSEHFTLEEIEGNVYRIGNLTLLESSKNNQCGDKPFIIKKKVYKSSQYALTNGIDFPEWSQSQIRSRQENLAKIATSCWRISQLDS